MDETRGRPSNRIRLVVTVATTVVILAFVNLQIAGKERIVSEGRTVLLRLAPADPRSLLQGDYMALRYVMASEVAAVAQGAGISDGTIIIETDENDVARFVALDRGQALAADQHRLLFRKRGESVRLASDAFFFEEGESGRYENARYGELRVAEDGTALLVGLRGDDRRPLEATPLPPNGDAPER